MLTNTSDKSLSKPESLSRDVVAGIRKLAPSPAAFWRATKLEDVVSSSTFLRLVGHQPGRRLSVKAVEDAYTLLLVKLGLTHEELDLLPDVDFPGQEEWAAAAERLLAAPHALFEACGRCLGRGFTYDEVGSRDKMTCPSCEGRRVERTTVGHEVFGSLESLRRRAVLAAQVSALGLREGPTGRVTARHLPKLGGEEP